MTLILNGTDNSVSAPAVQGGTAGTTTGEYFPATNQWAVATNGTQAMLVDASQNVGIGTTSPVTNLTISSASGAIGGDGIQYVQAVYTGTGTTNAGYTAKNYYGTSQFFQWNNNGTRLGNRIITNSGGGNLVFTYGNDSEGMRITSSGQLLVGTTSSDAKFTVVASGATFPLIRSQSDSPTSYGVYGQFNAKYGGTDRDWFFGQASDASFNFWDYTPGVTNRLKITSGGNIGINTTPVAMANGVGTQTGQSTIVQNIVGDQSLFANNAYYDSAWKAVRAQTGYSCMRPGAVAGGIQFMCSSVTTTAGGSLPNMDGSDIKLTIYPSGSIGAPTGSNIYNASDARLKKNIQPLAKGLDAVVALKPVSFNWITDFCEDENDKILYGFIAQETREVDENLVEGFSKGGSIIIGDLTVDSPMRVNEKFIIPMLVKAIQELKAEFDAYKATHP